MLNRCGFWGKKGHFCGEIITFCVMNDHLWGPSVHVDKSFKKIQARVRPPPHSGNAWILGVSIPDTPPLLKYIAQWIRFQCVCVQRMTWQWRWFTLIEVGRSGRKKSWNVNRFHSEKPLSTHKVGKKSWKVYFTLSPQYTKEQKLGRPYYYTTIWLPLFNLSYGI